MKNRVEKYRRRIEPNKNKWLEKELRELQKKKLNAIPRDIIPPEYRQVNDVVLVMVVASKLLEIYSKYFGVDIPYEQLYRQGPYRCNFEISMKQK